MILTNGEYNYDLVAATFRLRKRYAGLSLRPPIIPFLLPLGERVRLGVELLEVAAPFRVRKSFAG